MAAMILHSRQSSERGAALVEFALCLPLLLVVIAGIVDFAFLFQRYEVVTNAVREGARIAVLPGYNEDSVKARVRSYVQTGLDLSNASLNAVMPLASIDVTCPSLSVPIGGAGGGTTSVGTVLVTGTYRHSFLLLGSIMGLINGSWGDTIDIVSTSQMRLEPGASPCP